MKKKYFTLLLVCLFFWSAISYGQEEMLWKKVDDSKFLSSRIAGKVSLGKVQNFELKLSLLKRNLLKAPIESDRNSKPLKMEFPDKSGKMNSFWIKEAPVMDEALAQKHPNNKSYIGVGVDDAAMKVRFSVTLMGLHAMITNKEREIFYIDPIKNDRNYYRLFARKDINMQDNDFQCLVESSLISEKKSLSMQFKFANDLKLRTYRLALAVTGEYSQYHLDRSDINQSTASDAEKKEVVLAAMTVAMTRVNGVFENELALRLLLVSKNADIIYLNGDTDPYDNDDNSALLTQNQVNCDNVIGDENYDVGHVFNTAGGGVAYVESACQPFFKAGGVSGSLIPIGDGFYGTAAHEFGHQFGARHTFNGNSGSCADNISDHSSFEPGSGSTIMSYAGLCPSQNVQISSDLYFHSISISQMSFYISNSAKCGTETPLNTNLNVPTSNAGKDFTIPKSTPYKLIGEGADADGDPITYCWEQTDNQLNSVPPQDTDTNGTIYRSFSPTLENIRYMPDLKTVNSGSLSSTWEVTPSVARVINFNLTVRDNNAEGGQVAMDAMSVTVSGVAGPFVVTSQSANDIQWIADATEAITWDVAGTTGNGIDVANVNILLSKDGGNTYPIILASNTPNDGNQNITVPNIFASNCKIMIESVGNLFYAINDELFSIGEFTLNCGGNEAADLPLSIPDNNTNGVVSSLTILEDILISDINVTAKINHTFIQDITLTLESPQGTTIELISNQCSLRDNIDATFDDDGDALICSDSPPAISGTIVPSQTLSSFISESAKGVWKLKAVDGSPGDSGSVESWNLELCTSQALAVEFAELNNLKIYPNPSTGIIYISFLKTEDQVEMTLYDLLGRKIMNRSFLDSSSYFNEIIDSQKIAGGIYVLQIKNGNQFSSKKIQIQ